jgi:hypothetical protein
MADGRSGDGGARRSRTIVVMGACLAVTLLLGVPTASAVSVSNPAPITIPAGAPGSTIGPASPYPSAITVSNLTGTITKLTVTLSGYSHTVPADVGAVLVGPGSRSLELMDCSGGFATAAPIDLTIDDQAATEIAQMPAPTTGSYRPADHCAAADSYSAPGPGTNYGNPGPGHGSAPFATLASSFNGVDPNGTWNLFVQDFSGGDSGTIAGGWRLDLDVAGSTTGRRAAALKKCKKKHSKPKRKKCKKRAKKLPL